MLEQEKSKALIDKGLLPTSFFEIFFKDGSMRTEHEINWSDISESHEVVYPNGSKKTFNGSSLQFSKIRIHHEGLSSELEVGDDLKAYQAVCERMQYCSDGTRSKQCVGRIFGVVDSSFRVVKESFLDAKMNEVIGLAYTNVSETP